jgi:RND family efflux transporter, MFP subunit
VTCTGSAADVAPSCWQSRRSSSARLQEGPAAAGAPPPPEVGIVTVAPEAGAVTYDFSGGVQPYRRVEVRARVEGVILARSFTEGQVVRAGQLLYRIDPVRTNAACEGARARADNARRTLSRLEPLLAEHAVAQQDVDNARAELASARAALADARKGVEDANVRAEITGRVGRALYQVGDRVTGSDNLLTTIDVVDPVYVVFRPSTQQMLAWRQDPRAARSSSREARSGSRSPSPTARCCRRRRRSTS